MDQCARAEDNRTYGLSPTPGAFLQSELEAIKLVDAGIEDPTEGVNVGNLTDTKGGTIESKNGTCRLIQVPPAGGRVMSSKEWIRGSQGKSCFIVNFLLSSIAPLIRILKSGNQDIEIWKVFC